MKMHEINELSLDELKLQLEDTKEELANLRYQKALGQLNNPLRLRIVRREIARLNTVFHEYEIGIRKRPGEVQEEK
ncbi:MAG TPA: 50S ribosomal protein L29 [Bacteroidetes bacterium]|nr:50S ribosomal protein L29 [Bacteroidota bacterium]